MERGSEIAGNKDQRATSGAMGDGQTVVPITKKLEPTAYTVSWICAIATEYAAARVFLDERHEKQGHTQARIANHCTFGRIGKHNVVLAVLPRAKYGKASAASVGTYILCSFPNIRIGLMVGIGGGAPSQRHDIRLGDIVVSAADKGNGGVFQYDFGKSIQEE
jgi:hypothetical protein